jgi:PAS domain S-box-containing protein
MPYLIAEWAGRLLQLGVAFYALRLNRLFGARHVGWSLFSAFCLLALLRGFEAAPGSGLPGATIKIELANALVSVLILLSLLHIETVIRERLRAERAEAEIRGNLESLVKEKTIELTRANEELRSSEEQYRFLFKESPQPMWVFDRNSFEFLAINNAALRHYGFTLDEFQALTARNIRPAEDIAAFLEDVARSSAGTEPRGVWRQYKKGGAIADVEISIRDFGYKGRAARLVLANDVTERLVLERQLRQAQKMEAIGQLAGGVAHDFNNLLTVIRGHTDLLLMDSPAPGSVEHLNQIAAAGDRAAGLTRQLLAFSRRNVMQMAVVDINAVVENLTKMLRRLIGEDIVLETRLDPNLPYLRADASTLEQVIINLAVNARDAMPTGGVLNIGTERVTVSEAHVHRHREARMGDFVCLSVRDSGCGIAPEVLTHLFEPFFTTKDIGKGTGLGLATVHGIVKQHSGWIEISTAVGAGSEFQIYLPAAPRSELLAAGKMEPSLPRNQGNETVLLVEDEAPVRRLTRSILNRFGYRVIEADCGATALALWEENDSKVDLLLTDMIMPGGITGRDLANRLRQTRPDLKVVYTSGYSPSRAGQDLKILSGLKFLPKPYSPGQLIRAVQNCLGNGHDHDPRGDKGVPADTTQPQSARGIADLSSPARSTHLQVG